MADRPIKTPLPADLPEDWTSGQIVAPAGADVGLSEQHGYNYLMAAVNAAQRAANAINESFDNISGKRTCRVTVGTSTAGWTKADCDYLCDGANDDAQLDAALVAVVNAGGGEIAILSGEYQIKQYHQYNFLPENTCISFRGEPGSTVLNLSGSLDFSSVTENQKICYSLSDIAFRYDGALSGTESGRLLSFNDVSVRIEGCGFYNVGVEWMQTGHPQGQQFVFRGNTMEHTFFGYRLLIVSSFAGQNSAVISSNVFRFKWGGNSSGLAAIELYIEGSFDGLDKDANYLREGVIFSGNHVSRDTAGKRVRVLAGSGSVVSDNIFKGVGVYAAHDVACVGNRVHGASITGAGYGQITGNIVAAPAGASAITLTGSGSLNDVPAERTANITGNTITSGGVGIHLAPRDTPYQNVGLAKALVASNRITGCETSIKIESNWSGCLVTGNILDSSVVDSGTGNIVRLNSDDAGSGGGGGTAGVSSFNGRSGAVLPLTGDYTAAMVGARPDTWTPTAADVGAIPAGAVRAVQALTQEEYDALTEKDAGTLYLIKE